MNKDTIGVMDVVQIVLIVLKLCHVINWSWWWVLSPSWGMALIIGIVAWFVWMEDRK